MRRARTAHTAAAALPQQRGAAPFQRDHAAIERECTPAGAATSIVGELRHAIAARPVPHEQDSNAPPRPQLNSTAAAALLPPDVRAAIKEHPWRGGVEPCGDLDYELDASCIEGTLPAALQGTLYRCGPGRIRVGRHRYAHWCVPCDADISSAASSF